MPRFEYLNFRSDLARKEAQQVVVSIPIRKVLIWWMKAYRAMTVYHRIHTHREFEIRVVCCYSEEMKISHRIWWYMTLALASTPMGSHFLIHMLLFRFVLLPNLHIGLSSLTGRYCLDVTLDRPRYFSAPTASLVLDHLNVV